MTMFGPSPDVACVGVTHDDGTVFARAPDRAMSRPWPCTSDPCSSRRRGGDENRNGMIRRYLSRRCEIRMDVAKKIREIVDETANRPMRVPDYLTPNEAFVDELLELQDRWERCIFKQTTRMRQLVQTCVILYTVVQCQCRLYQRCSGGRR